MLVSWLFLITSLRERLTQQAVLTGMGGLHAGSGVQRGGHESPAAI